MSPEDGTAANATGGHDECKDTGQVYRVVTATYSGRSLVTTRAIEAGTQILQERPVLVGPTATSAPICLSCHAPTSIVYSCPRCQWPMCSEACAEHPAHKPECQVLAQDTRKVGVPICSEPTPRYDLILMVRFLLLKDSNPELWDRLMTLESHWALRKSDNEPHHNAAVQYFMKICHTAHDEETLHKVRGIIITNCINCNTPAGVTLRGLYPAISLLNHSCLPNVVLRSDQNGQLFVNTATDIEEDDPLNFCYLPVGDPFWRRQRDLRDIYYFTCECERCTDHNELNLHFSALKCHKCKKQYLDPMFNKKKTWRCMNCRNNIGQEKVMRISKSIQALYLKEKEITDVPTAMQLLKKVHSAAHGQHYTWLGCAAVILRALCSATSIDARRLKKQLWMRVIEMYNVLEPGKTRRRGVSMLQLASVSVLLAIQDHNLGRISRVGLLEEIDKIQLILTEARQILQLEPPNSSEQRWLMMADKEQRRLDEIVDKVLAASGKKKLYEMDAETANEAAQEEETEPLSLDQVLDQILMGADQLQKKIDQIVGKSNNEEGKSDEEIDDVDENERETGKLGKAIDQVIKDEKSKNNKIDKLTYQEIETTETQDLAENGEDTDMVRIEKEHVKREQKIYQTSKKVRKKSDSFENAETKCKKSQDNQDGETR